MDWILDNLQLVIAIAGMIAYWLNARNKDKAGEPADYDGDGEPDNPLQGSRRDLAEHAGPIEYDERMRRVREEIQRKIAERQGAGRPNSDRVPDEEPSLVPDLPRSSLDRREEVLFETRTAEVRRREEEAENAAVIERQRRLSEQLAELKARRAEAGRAARAANDIKATAIKAVRENPDESLLGDLRSGQSLRRAIVLREVLGAPVSLR